MRKEYKKPLVAIENYYLSDMIAACDTIFVDAYNSSNIDVQQAISILSGPAFKVFTTGCDSPADSTSEDVFAAVGVCYHTFNQPDPTKVKYVFNS